LSSRAILANLATLVAEFAQNDEAPRGAPRRLLVDHKPETTMARAL